MATSTIVRSNIYKYYEYFDLFDPEKKIVRYKCLYCYDKFKKKIENENSAIIKQVDHDSEFNQINFLIKTTRGQTSNLIKHLQSSTHEKLYEEFNSLQSRDSPSQSKKRKLFDESSKSNSIKNASNSLIGMGAISVQPKYSMNSPAQRERFIALVEMIVSCMLPISIVEKEKFRNFLNKMDPSFTTPGIYAIKYDGLTELTYRVTEKIQNHLNRIKYPNISLDIWSDATMRSFTGFICQGNHKKN
jgi:hypothetical protein